MRKVNIRLNETSTVNSVNTDNWITVDVPQTTKPLNYTSLKEEIDQYEVFQQERDNCNQYRIITTIHPYCTNILYNPVTEIIKDEGSDNVEIITDQSVVDIENKDVIFGKTKNLNRYDMIKNTEYSNAKCGYEYSVGTDIFGNHLLRNNSFKLVMPISKIYSASMPNNQQAEVFNTLGDYLRRYDGSNVTFSFRTVNDQEFDITNNKTNYTHLYIGDDIDEITDAINNNLIEENGWWGFINKPTIKPKTNQNYRGETPNWVSEDFNKIINNKNECDFIDLFPDRTLFSFNPKYNPYKHRAEYNWNICITYPYRNFYDHKLIKDNDNASTINALLINKVECLNGTNGEQILLFQTPINHKLKVGNFINLYYKIGKKTNDIVTQNDFYTKIEQIRITGVGDLSNNNKKYYFQTNNLNLLEELSLQDENDYEIINERLGYSSFRFKHIINGYESEYYIRLFRKLPNLLKSSNALTADIMQDVNKIDKYLDDEENNKYFNRENYQLAFSSTIYNDNNTQITFTDGFNVDNLLDNRGRPISELFLTIIKNNKGNKTWYNSLLTDNAEIGEYEYSRCFSEVSCGFDLYWQDKFSSDEEHRKFYVSNAECSDVKTLYTPYFNEHEQKLVCNYKGDFGWSNFNNITFKSKATDITIDDNVFIGDIVEFNPVNCNEIVMEDAQFRFNTYMREHEYELRNVYHFQYDDITKDDYTIEGGKPNFQTTTMSHEYETDRSKNGVFAATTNHFEGYYYKPHYSIQLKDYGELKQGSHYNLRISSMELGNLNGKPLLYITITTPHKFNVNNVLLICDDSRNRIMATKIAYVKNEYTFAITGVGKLTCQNLYDILNNQYSTIRFKLRRYNESIPFYAQKLPNVNIYMWRELNASIEEYPFANGYLYINQDINFYLKRQDPFNKVGLYYTGTNGKGIIPNDVYGNTLQPSNFDYKTETEASC